MRPVHHRAILVHACCLLCFAILLIGCPSKAPPPGVRFPITTGSHHILPATQQRILVSSDPRLTDIAIEWLRAHHYSNVVLPDGASLHTSNASPRPSDRKAALALAKEMKADLVLFVERELGKESLVGPQCEAFFYVNVSLQGVSVNSEETVLRGTAHYPHCVDLSEQTVRSLICQTFATAWGFRPPGQLDIPSNLMCTVGQTEPMPTH